MEDIIKFVDYYLVKPYIEMRTVGKSVKEFNEYAIPLFEKFKERREKIEMLFLMRIALLTITPLK